MRAQGGASKADSDLINQLNKRSLVTFGCVLAHCYMLTEFLYQTKLITPQLLGPRIYGGFAYMLYPFGLAGTVWLYLRKNGALNRELDRKYTPIWIEISSKQAI